MVIPTVSVTEHLAGGYGFIAVITTTRGYQIWSGGPDFSNTGRVQLLHHFIGVVDNVHGSLVQVKQVRIITVLLYFWHALNVVDGAVFGKQPGVIIREPVAQELVRGQVVVFRFQGGIQVTHLIAQQFL